MDLRHDTQRRHVLRVRVAALAALLLLALSVGCGAPAPGSPEAAYEETVQAFESGDSERIFALLDPAFQRDVAMLLTLYGDARVLIAELYPPDQMASARAAVGGALFGTTSSPAELFGHLLREREDEPFSTLQRLGARAGGAVIDGDTAQVKTRAGDTWIFRRADDDTWRFVPAETDRVMLQETLRSLRGHIAKLREHRKQTEVLRVRGQVQPLQPHPAPAEESANEAGDEADTGDEATPPEDEGEAPGDGPDEAAAPAPATETAEEAEDAE